MLRRVACSLSFLYFVSGGAGFAQTHHQMAGSAACASCHPKQHRTQSQTHHALALRRIVDTPLADLLSDRPVRAPGGIEFNYVKEKDALQVNVTRGGQTISAPLLWAFGAGALAYTPVGLRDSGYFEHRVSWYSASGRPGMTLGHSAAPPARLEDAIGDPSSAQNAFRCFNCHATNVKPGPDLSGMEAGVRCERCHGAGQPHIENPKVKMLLPSRASAKETVAFCAECHRSPAPGAVNGEPERADALSIRFAPVGLLASRCFTESANLTCLTCHDPHENASRDAGFYTAKCITCHSRSTEVKSSCPRATKTSCLPCHMAKGTPVPDLTFTDHRIRVRRE